MVNWPDMQGQASDYKTYGIKTIPELHARKATCAEVDCAAYLHGWVTRVDESTELGMAQAYYLRNDKSRSHTETRDGTAVSFQYPPGMVCFASDSHRIQERPSLFVVRDGDFRGNPRGTPVRVHATPDDWVDDMANHQIKLAEQIKRERG